MDDATLVIGIFVVIIALIAGFLLYHRQQVQKLRQDGENEGWMWIEGGETQTFESVFALVRRKIHYGFEARSGNILWRYEVFNDRQRRMGSTKSSTNSSNVMCRWYTDAVQAPHTAFVMPLQGKIQGVDLQMLDNPVFKFMFGDTNPLDFMVNRLLGQDIDIQYNLKKVDAVSTDQVIVYTNGGDASWINPHFFETIRNWTGAIPPGVVLHQNGLYLWFAKVPLNIEDVEAIVNFGLTLTKNFQN